MKPKLQWMGLNACIRLLWGHEPNPSPSFVREVRDWLVGRGFWASLSHVRTGLRWLPFEERWVDERPRKLGKCQKCGKPVPIVAFCDRCAGIRKAPQ